MKQFTLESSIEIIEWLQKQLNNKRTLSFEVLSPDIGKYYSGTIVEIEGITYLYRSLKSWMDLANALQCKMLLPQNISNQTILITYEKLSPKDSFHTTQDSNEKYGIQSLFASIDKSNEFAFAYYYQKALEEVDMIHRTKIINLGINRGDEFALIQKLLSEDDFKAKEFVGVDYSPSAIKYAKERFKAYSNIHLYEYNIHHLDTLDLAHFDLLISIATLQSVSSNFKNLFMNLVQTLLRKDDSALIIGFPNSRWIDGELIYGAKVPHYHASELSTLIKDIYFCKKYLQQHKYRVRVIGKEYLFLIATKITIKA